MNNMTGYEGTFPVNFATDDDERLRKFISVFYAISDDRSRDDEWLGCFAADALLVMGDKKAKGSQEIRDLRVSMWETVKSRKHTLDKVFPATFEPNAGEAASLLIEYEYMLHGRAELELQNGGEKSTAHWAGRAILRDVEGELKYVLYQVYPLAFGIDLT